MDDLEQQRPECPAQDSPVDEQPHEPQGRHEPVPAVQAEYLRRLSEEAGEPVVELASQADACRRFRELQDKIGRRPKRILVNEQTDG